MTIRYMAIVAMLCGCAAEREPHGELELPLYVHLCDAMPRADKEAWGAAAGDINQRAGEPVLWVGHGEPVGCSTVDLCFGKPRAEANSCRITLRYEVVDPGLLELAIAVAGEP